MNENLITVCGNLVADPETRRTKRTGDVFCVFRVASTPRHRNGDGQYVNGEPNFYRVAAFRNLAVNALASLKKGDPVVVQGRLKVEQWTDDDGKSRTGVNVEAYAIGHDLSWCHTRMTKGVASHPNDRLGDPEVRATLREEDPWRPHLAPAPPSSPDASAFEASALAASAVDDLRPMGGDPPNGHALNGDPLDRDPLARDPLARDPLARDPLARDPLDTQLDGDADSYVGDGELAAGDDMVAGGARFPAAG